MHWKMLSVKWHPFGLGQNLSHVEFISGNIETYLHFLSILNNVMGQVVKILPSGRLSLHNHTVAADD